MGTSWRRKWIYALALFFSLLFSLSTISVLSGSYAFNSGAAHQGPQYAPSFAYYISGSGGDKERIMRLLLAVFHPRNIYLLHLSSEASDEDREWLANALTRVPAVRAFANVNVVGKSIWLTDMGATNIVATLRAASILLKIDGGWDWFITLSASDYPLLTQDDLAHVFSSVRRDLNFIDHTGHLGWKEKHRIRPIIVDPSIYLARRSKIFTATQKRPEPVAFKVFTGSPWVTLSRSFLNFCIIGWDNLPRTVLLYFNNVVLPQGGYFHSVVCNAPEFKNTTVNNDLRYMVWDNPPKMVPHFLNKSNFDKMVQSGAAFARRFHKDDPVLTMIDNKILKRRPHAVAPGAWCAGADTVFTDVCSQWGDVNSLKPSFQAKRFAKSMSNLLDDLKSRSTQCR